MSVRFRVSVSVRFRVSLEQHLDEASAFEAGEMMDDLQDPCGCFHKAGEFCYCDDPAYLQ